MDFPLFAVQGNIQKHPGACRPGNFRILNWRTQTAVRQVSSSFSPTSIAGQGCFVKAELLTVRQAQINRLASTLQVSRIPPGNLLGDHRFNAYPCGTPVSREDPNGLLSRMLLDNFIDMRYSPEHLA